MAPTVAIDPSITYRLTGVRQYEISDVAGSHYDTHDFDYISRFYTLLEQWRDDTITSSHIQDKVDHPAFQQIINLGSDIIPLIINELRLYPDFLFLVLEEIVGHGPDIPTIGRHPSQIIDAWLIWADRNRVATG